MMFGLARASSASFSGNHFAPASPQEFPLCVARVRRPTQRSLRPLEHARPAGFVLRATANMSLKEGPDRGVSGPTGKNRSHGEPEIRAAQPTPDDVAVHPTIHLSPARNRATGRWHGRV